MPVRRNPHMRLTKTQKGAYRLEREDGAIVAISEKDALAYEQAWDLFDAAYRAQAKSAEDIYRLEHTLEAKYFGEDATSSDSSDRSP